MPSVIVDEFSDRAISMSGLYPGIRHMEPEVFLGNLSMRLFGSPFQFLDSVDKRFDDLNPDIGNEFLRNVMMNSPIVTFKPGMPQYQGGDNSTIKDFAKEMLTGSTDNRAQRLLVSLSKNTIFSSGSKLEKRLFGFRHTYWRYISSVNYMCRTTAIYLGIESAPVFVGGGSYYTLSATNPINWGYYRFNSGESFKTPLDTLFGRNEDRAKDLVNRASSSTNGLADQTITSILGAIGSSVKNAIGELWDNITGSVNDFIDRPVTVSFMVEPASFTESFRNETSESMIEQAIGSLDQGIGSEIAFITNSNVDTGILGNVVDFLGTEIGNATQALGDLVSRSGGGGFVSNLVSGGLRSLKGQKMIYPNIYRKSDVQMNYTFTIKLRSPYGDKYNYYMNILVPLFHLICLAVPRMVSSNATTSPFLCQCYIPGLCTCNLGIISDMSINKNPLGADISVDGYPLAIDVTVTVQDLYQAMAISPADDPASFLYNQTLSEYLANMAGLEPSVATSREMNAVYMVGIKDFFTPENWLNGLLAEPITGSVDEFFGN